MGILILETFHSEQDAARWTNQVYWFLSPFWSSITRAVLTKQYGSSWKSSIWTFFVLNLLRSVPFHSARLMKIPLGLEFVLYTPRPRLPSIRSLSKKEHTNWNYHLRGNHSFSSPSLFSTFKAKNVFLFLIKFSGMTLVPKMI